MSCRLKKSSIQYFLRADIKFSPVDEALCHHVQRSRIKAVQKALENAKRKAYAETPQGEADAERHAYLSRSDLKRKDEPFFKSAKKSKKHYASGVERHAYFGRPNLKRKSEPFFKSAKKLEKPFDHNCPIDDALCHHGRRSRIKAKQKALENAKRKTHGETPQAEADVERHA
ncbi:hypothetical protein PoB_007396400 [Plakobranchus ocellatus]|uniref:Uncharacterized protein n=1 Tax=Plakobranchus ocellatus TaxID=259542 RepID=A0AAV4DTX9_9GAST|nr:hypothetical protein PoB_007396400 [Plakobranchus ocellatus]